MTKRKNMKKKPSGRVVTISQTSMEMLINRYQRQHNRSEINWFLVEENILARDYSRGRQ